MKASDFLPGTICDERDACYAIAYEPLGFPGGVDGKWTVRVWGFRHGMPHAIGYQEAETFEGVAMRTLVWLLRFKQRRFYARLNRDYAVSYPDDPRSWLDAARAYVNAWGQPTAKEDPRA
jgi:hypothetical protein